MESKMTIEEALQATLRLLEGIPVKISDYQAIGQPIAMAAGNLRAVLDAIAQQQAPEADDTPEVDENGVSH